MKYVFINPGHDIDRKEIHGVHQQHPHEDGQCRGRYEFVAVAVEYSFDLLVDEFHREFDEGLALAWHAGSCAAHHPPEKAKAHDTEQDRHHQRVDMEHPEVAGPHLRCHVRQVVRYIFG